MSTELEPPFVFIGDSITDCGRREDPEGLGDGYVRILAGQLPGPVINRGISGERTNHLRGRWKQDVTAFDPRTLTIYIGVNDTLMAYWEDGDTTTLAQFEERFRFMLERTGGARVIVIQPFLLPVVEAEWVDWYDRWRADLAPKQQLVEALAAEYGTAYVPLQRLMDAAAAEHGVAALALDGVHPTAFGHELIARAWMTAAG